MRKLPDWLRCPEPTCRQALVDEGVQVICSSGNQDHRFPKIADIVHFAPGLDIGKYNSQFAALYAGLWAYSHELLHQGGNEGFYRTVLDLATGILIRDSRSRILDLGCGVGRITRDLAGRFPNAEIIGLDGSTAMLDLAIQFTILSERRELDLSSAGYLKPIEFQGAGLVNVEFFQGDATSTPFKDGTFSLVICANLIDRVDSPSAVFKEIARILSPNGRCILTSPLNWDRSHNWRLFPDKEAVLQSIQDSGLQIQKWFDGVQSKEFLDTRNNYISWNTLVVIAEHKQ